MSKLIDLTGEKYGRLTVIKRVSDGKNKHPRWLCKCDCGNETTVSGSNLMNNSTKSCGCLRRELGKKHGREQNLEYGFANMRAAIRSYKKNAEKRGIKYNITEEQFKEITQRDCYYCGAKPSNSFEQPKSNGAYIYNGMDRINSTKGYTIDNVVPCCRACNQAKSNYTIEEFKDWVLRVYVKLWK